MGLWLGVSWTPLEKKAKFGKVLTGEVMVDVAHELIELFLRWQQGLQEAITAALLCLSLGQDHLGKENQLGQGCASK